MKQSTVGRFALRASGNPFELAWFRPMRKHPIKQFGFGGIFDLSVTFIILQRKGIVLTMFRTGAGRMPAGGAFERLNLPACSRTISHAVFFAHSL
jgi:hypothetical protein